MIDQRIGNKNYSQDNKKLEISVGTTKERCLTYDLTKIAKEFYGIEKTKQSFAQLIRNHLTDLDFLDYISYYSYRIKEKSLVKPVKLTSIKGLKIAAVDGSLVTKKFQGIDLIFLKSIVVKYFFTNPHSAEISYYPDVSGYNNYSIQTNYFNINENGIDLTGSLEQTFMEINQLNSMLKDSDEYIDLIILDGSILVSPINLLFSQNYEISKRYDRVLKEYRRLYRKCQENNITLVGSIKDTRTAALANTLTQTIQMLISGKKILYDFLKVNYRELIKYFTDYDLFSRVLDVGERTCVFRCNTDIDKIRDTNIKKNIPNYFPVDFYAFYLKNVPYDNAIRLEFFMNESDDLVRISKKADLIASIIYPLSNLNKNYGLPIPQIEAHKRAVFKSDEINLIFNSLKALLHKHGLSFFEKRRNRRPF